ncbi:hypothetical protein GH714_017298 [Hevea brasiliensis]|uniref:N-acetyltransferase domain-containing protein n=1 Tax=Hevea brasiliensis TaxID=3981 RepID=A0A6A6NI42_HEVBR|nr:hypothetical protein GH714_017298 [Hevea brasiliensis]
MAAKADSAHQMPCLYEIDISHLLSLDGEITKKLCLIRLSYGRDLVAQPYTVLFSLEDDNMGNAISKTFAYYPDLKSKSLAGARIVHLFQIPDASQDGYGSTSLDILTRFYDGKAIVNAVQEGPLVNLQKKWAKLHYIGVYSDLTVNAVSRWEGYGFLVFFVGKLMISGADKRCSVIALAELEEFGSCVHTELITHLVQDLAEGYFTGKLPIELSDDEETVLLVNVLQQQPPFIGDNDARSKLRNIFEKAIELYNTLSPEVYIYIYIYIPPLWLCLTCN